jgi:hypothetical protein
MKLIKEDLSNEKKCADRGPKMHINGTKDAAIEVWAVGTQSCRPQFF